MLHVHKVFNWYYLTAVLQVINAQLRASQIENRHLRRCGVPQQLQELQDAYALSSEALEVKNTTLLHLALVCFVCLDFYIQMAQKMFIVSHSPPPIVGLDVPICEIGLLCCIGTVYRVLEQFRSVMLS